jgi:serine phosphatase RsbU (regulator of sigma subunit)
VTQVSIDRLALLHRLTRTFNSSLDLNYVLDRVMDEVIAATRAERGFLMLRDAGGQLVFRVARGMDQQTIQAPAFQISRGLAERVAAEGVPLLTSDAQKDAWLAARASVLDLRLRSILCVPLQVKDTTIGVVYVDNRWHTGIFTPNELQLLTTIADQAAIAIENARLYQLAVEKGRLERELQVARDVQTGLIPAELPQISGWEFAALWQPARVVGGDYYDVLALGERPDRSGSLALVIADVSDKGMPAALFMASARSTLRGCAAGSASPAACIRQTNRLLCADASGGMFVTLVYGQLDLDSGELIYVNAGHNPPWLCRTGGELLELTRTGVVLGVDEAEQYGQSSVTLQPGDLLLLYTDGVTEAVDERGEAFGEDRLRHVVLANCGAPAAEVLRCLEAALREFTGAMPQHDDITVCLAKRRA